MFLTILINFLLTINIVVCVLIILLVLMQRPKSEGLGAAFGGGMTENLFGAQTTTVLTNITRWLGGVFFALTLILSILYSQQAKQMVKSSNILDLLKSAPPVSAEAVPAPVKKIEPAVVAPAVSEKTEAAAAVSPKIEKTEPPVVATPSPSVGGTSNP